MLNETNKKVFISTSPEIGKRVYIKAIDRSGNLRKRIEDFCNDFSNMAFQIINIKDSKCELLGVPHQVKITEIFELQNHRGGE